MKNEGNTTKNEGSTEEIGIQDQDTEKRRVYCGRTKLQVQITGIVSRRKKLLQASTSGSVGRSEYRSTSRRSTITSGSVGRSEYCITSRRITSK
jgi:hypothetical protein